MDISEYEELLNEVIKIKRPGLSTDDQPRRVELIIKFLPLFIWMAEKIINDNSSRTWKSYEERLKQCIHFWQYLTCPNGNFDFNNKTYTLHQLNTFLQVDSRHKQRILNKMKELAENFY
jgi:hypothetical protein